MSDRVGQQLGHYHLQRLLGRGAFAEVYLAQHRYLEVPAAIKVLHVSMDQEAQEQFQREARTLARLQHPHIVRVLDFGIEDQTPYLVLEYMQGGTLRSLHPKGSRLSLEQITSYVKQIAPALDYAHQQQVIHRDIKPENLLVSSTGEVLLSDFGIAVVQRTLSSLDTQPPAGTPLYMAPEQIQGHPCAASDQYALGVLVYEWLVGEPPFRGSLFEVYSQHLHRPPPSLRERLPELPPAVEDTVFGALAKDPAARFVNVQDFATVLGEVCLATQSQTSLTTTELLPARARRMTLPPLPTSMLPAQPTPLIGREKEVALLQELLMREQVRLVTLTGAGGAGKTRLGLQVAAELSDLFPDGVYFVNLAPISDPEFVMPTIAQTLGFREEAGQSLLEHLQEELQQKQLLLVLDNFEQVVNAASQFVELLAACPKLKLLVTSREVLHVRAEHEFAVPPLALPDPTHLPELAELSHYAAVALFTQRAQAVKSDFQVTAANARAIAEICVRLDGLPLAIELAAARIKLFPPQALLARLDQRLHILTSGARDVPVRQQSLRNTLAWSYELLHAEEQLLFRRLSAFVGGCTLQAIEALCAALDKSNGVRQVLGGVASLIDKSLLKQTEQEGEEPRLGMLETIREYGLEALEALGEMDVTRHAHATYYLRLAEEAEPELVGPLQSVWFERLEREHDNLRAAMQWLLEQEGTEQRSEMALRLGRALLRFWEVRGHWSEAWNFLAWARAGSKGSAVPAQVKALMAAAHLLYHLENDIDHAEGLYEESLALSRALGDTAGIAQALLQLGEIAGGRGNFTVAYTRVEEALTLFRGVDDKQGIAWALNDLAVIVRQQGDYARAISLNEQSLALFRAVGDMDGIVWSLFELAEVLFLAQGDPEKLRALLEEGLAICREVGLKQGIAWALRLLGEVSLQQGDAGKARVLLEEGAALSRKIGQKHDTAESLLVLGTVAASEGDYAAARAHYEESLALASKMDKKPTIAPSLECLAGVVAAQGEFAWAARLWGAAEVLREAMGAPIPPVYRAAYKRAVDATRTQLGEKAFTAARDEGRMMTPEQAFAAQGRR